MRLTAAQRTCINEFISRQIEFHFHISARGTRGQSAAQRCAHPDSRLKWNIILCACECVCIVSSDVAVAVASPPVGEALNERHVVAPRGDCLVFFYSRGNELSKILAELLHMCPWPDK